MNKSKVTSKIDEESEKETLEILRDKKLMKIIKKSEEDFKKGRFYDWEKVKQELGIKARVSKRFHNVSS